MNHKVILSESQNYLGQKKKRKKTSQWSQIGGGGLLIKSCLTLCDLMDCSPPDSSVHGISQIRILEWVAIFFSRGVFLTQESNPSLLHYKQILYR